RGGRAGKGKDVAPSPDVYRAPARPQPPVILRGCEEILSGVGPRGGSEGSSVTPAGLGPIAQTVRLVAQRGRWCLRRSVGNVDPVQPKILRSRPSDPPSLRISSQPLRMTGRVS